MDSLRQVPARVEQRDRHNTIIALCYAAGSGQPATASKSEKAPTCGAFAEPSDGLEPVDPLLTIDVGGGWWRLDATVSAWLGRFAAVANHQSLRSVAPSFFHDLST
jgi:hypothetical protein